MQVTVTAKCTFCARKFTSLNATTASDAQGVLDDLVMDDIVIDDLHGRICCQDCCCTYCGYGHSTDREREMCDNSTEHWDTSFDRSDDLYDVYVDRFLGV